VAAHSGLQMVSASFDTNSESITYISSSEPLFWMLHGMVDKVWYDWQRSNPTNTMAFGGSTVGGGPYNVGILSALSIRFVVN
jgi:hypothetical protein